MSRVPDRPKYVFRRQAIFFDLLEAAAKSGNDSHEGPTATQRISAPQLEPMARHRDLQTTM
jgi:hypothetical protein